MKKLSDILSEGTVNESVEDMKCPDCNAKLAVGYTLRTKKPFLYCPAEERKGGDTYIKYELTTKRV